MGLDSVILALGISAISCFVGIAGYFMKKQTQELEAAKILASQMSKLAVQIEFMGKSLETFAHAVEGLESRVHRLEVTTAIHEEKINVQ